MNKTLIAGLVNEFQKSYDSTAKDLIWQEHSTTFRRFWSEQILAQGIEAIPDDACDVVIRILDRNGKGNTKASEAVANTRVPQGAWRRMFNSIYSNRELAELIEATFKEEKPSNRAMCIDKLYKINEGNKNRLTSRTGIVINALLAAYDPVNNLTVVSLDDRKAQLDFLESKLPFDWDKTSIGSRIVQSNLLLREETHAMGVLGSARTQSCFWYFHPVKELWKPEHTVKRTDKEVSVTVPQNIDTHDVESLEADELRESLQMQAILADIGSQMGFKIWLPRSDRVRVLKKWKPDSGDLLDELPLSFDKTTMKTIEQIDVLWLKKRSIARAFEVEHTTSVYSGLLRMADLLAMQPNLNIRLHIVAPDSRREKVLHEIRRPVFSLLEGKPLSESCTFLSYDSIVELRNQKYLEHLSDDVLNEYEERSEEAD